VRQRNARHQRHIGGADAAVGEINRGRRLRGARHPDQHHIGFLQAFDVLPVIMHHGVIQRVDALEIFGVEHVLRADAACSSGAKIRLEQLHHRADDRQARNIHLLAFGFQPLHQILLQEREQHDAGRFLDLVQHALELLLAPHQRIDMLHGADIGVLRGYRARHRNQRFSG
jgi:hypothetical protein